ncbi:MAG TPA: FAD-dependent oxidoreductase [Pirellulaceae bacterium]|jgi:hypothetical protein|nr:FAD-dependent oxidoreductase [Pirellulaceae bacterium]
MYASARVVRSVGVFATLLFALAMPFATVAAQEPPIAAEAQTYDVLIYGATPAGIAAAVQAAQSESTRGEARVVLVEPTGHVGGMTTSGLLHVDYRTYEGVTGFYLAFTRRVEAHYRDKYGADSEQLATSRRGTHAEPHVNELVFEAMLAEAKSVTVVKNLRLKGVAFRSVALDFDPVKRLGRQLASATFVAPDGSERTIAADVFIDATYEGDLMAAAGVPYRVGREGRKEYGETLAPEEPDGQLQGYNYRAIMTQDPENRVAVEQPANYRREKFVGVVDLFDDGRLTRVFGYPSKCVFKAQIPKLPNGKYDINDVSHGPVRLSLPGDNLAWPDGDEATRATIAQRHRDWQVGLLWFLQHDSAVPKKIREEALSWGWARDEFTDNGHFPWQLYVREARRMARLPEFKGASDTVFGDEERHVFTERHVQASSDGVRARYVPSSIAMGDYGPNCHGTAHEGPYFGGKHVGEFYKPVAPYQIPYGCMLAPEVDNLIVPVACASSHVGFCALRLEPIWSSMGQAAGAAAALAVAYFHRDLAGVPPGRIRERLHASGAATIYVSDVLPGDERFEAVQWLGSVGGLHAPTHGIETVRRLGNQNGTPAAIEPYPEGYGQRGKNEIGQYFEAFPGHAFEPDAVADVNLFVRWWNLVPPHARDQTTGFELSGRVANGELTRGELVQILYELAG